MIYTFYSFKGGVGRSMALANVAELLYKQGSRVLIVDFDLEAPGLEGYFNLPEAVSKHKDIQANRGVIDLLLSYKEIRSLPNINEQTLQGARSHDKAEVIPNLQEFENLNSSDQLNKPKKNNEKGTFPFSVEPLRNFVVPIYKENNKGGSLSIITAGARENEKFTSYARRIRSFDWDDFYMNWDGELFFEWFRMQVESIADYVLIDSRTGVSEMSGVCTYQLADTVVLFVSPNQQNLDGTLMVAKSLSNPKLVKEGRNGRDLSLLFVPSRVEGAESYLLDEFRDDFNKKFKQYFENSIFKENTFLKLKIPYVAYYAYMEKVAVRDYPHRTTSVELYEAYNNLLKALLRKKDEAKISETLSENELKAYELRLLEAQKLFSKILQSEYGRDTLAEVLKVVEIYQEISKADLSKFGQEATQALTTLSNYLHNNGANESIDILNETINIQKQLVEADNLKTETNLAENLFDLTNWHIEIKNYSRALKFIQEAVNLYRKLKAENRGDVDADLAKSLIILSECLLETNDTKNAKEKAVEAVNIYKALFDNSPDKYEIETAKSYNALLDILALDEINKKIGDISLVEEAERFFRRLSSINPHTYKPDLAKTINMLTNTLIKEGKFVEAIEKQKEAIEIFREIKTSKIFKEIRELDPDYYESALAAGLINLSNFLSEQDSQSALEAAHEALEIYRENPGYYETEIKETDELIFRVKIDKILSNLNKVQEQEMKELADEIVSVFDAKIDKLSVKQRKRFEAAKNGNWQTKLRFVIPLIPYLGINFEIEKEIESTMITSKIRKMLQSDEMISLNLSDDSE